MKRIQTRPGYWIQKHVVECMLCGKIRERRTRMHTKRPADARLRVVYTQEWCGCGYG